MRRRGLGRLTLGTLLAAPALAQGGALRLVVPFAPGGSQDVLGRLFAAAAGPLLGVTVVVENRAGAGGLLGGETVAHAPPDGTTLLLATAGQLTIPAAIGRRMPYDPMAELAPVLHLVDSPVVLLGAPDLPVADARAALALARRTPAPLAYGSTGIGTNTHLVMEDLKAREGLRLEHVPYRGAAAAFNDLLAGRLALMFVNVSSVLGFAGAGLKLLAVAAPTRFPALPDVPTLAEAGVPGFEASIWTGLVAPAGTPAALVARLGGAFGAALRAPALQARLMELGAVENGAEAAAFGGFLREDLARWQRVAASLRIRLD
jgi:tripartite-type tricarboxylate transporter receptor subunit TctC